MKSRGIPSLVIALLAGAYQVIASPANEAVVRRAYKDLIDAENRHDLAALRALVWNSGETLFVAKAPVGWRGYWGIEDVMQHLREMYQQPFRIEPAYEEEKVVFIKPDLAETYVPVKISVAFGGQNPAPRPFVMVLIWIKTPAGWKMTTDIPIPPDPVSK